MRVIRIGYHLIWPVLLWMALGLGVRSSEAQPVLPAGGRAVLEVPAINASALSVRDKALRIRFAKITQFSEPCEVSATRFDYGIWEEAGAGRVIWRLFVSAPGATDLNLGITNLFIPQGCTVRLVSADGSYTAGSYTFKDNTAFRQLWTPVVPGDWVCLEAEMPEEAVSSFALVIGRVNRGYADVFRKGFPTVEKGLQAFCNNDVNCPVGDGWRNEIRSVGLYTIDGTYLCSGTMVMNVRGDFKPYFLTAAHCLSSSYEAATVVVYWNYQSPICGALSGGALNQNQSGSALRATYSPSDFTLLELNQMPSPAFQVYYAGWDGTGNGASAAVCIHHPMGGEKAISFENQAVQSTENGSTIRNAGASYWRVIDWDSGATEPGSSGSGLWNASSHRLIGQLYGGLSACDNNESDWFGKFSSSWTGGGAAGSQLSSWLDPDGTGLTRMDGTNPPAITGHAIGDYDGDGRTDLAIFDTLGGYWDIESVNGNVLASANQWGWSTAKPVAGDYDGDGVWDLAVFDTGGGYWYIRNLAGGLIAWANQWGWSTAKPVPGDYDGDGAWDLAVFDTGGGYWYIRSVAGGEIAWANQWGWSTAKPVPGDYDGDGVWDLAVFDTGGGYWYIKRRTGGVIAWANQWGWSTATPVPGDYDGDGVWDLAVFDTEGGYWYIRSVTGEVITWANQWGWNTAKPVSGDFDGDGKCDLAVYDTASGRWYIKSVAGDVIVWGLQWGWWNAFPVTLREMPSPDSRTSSQGYYRTVQGTLDTQGFAAAVNFAKTAGAVGKVFVMEDGTQRTVRDLDIRDDQSGVWVVGDGRTRSSYSAYYFYTGAQLRMRIYLGW
jgi:hypothetical protein